MLKVTKYEGDYIVQVAQPKGSSLTPRGAVRVIHLESKLTCTCAVYNSVHKNKAMAIEWIEKELNND